MGAVASGGIVFLNQEVVEKLGISALDVRRVINREQDELERRERLYGASRRHLTLKAQRVVLVDDGIATGSTMKAAIQAVRQQEAGEIIVAVPVAPPSVRAEFESYADAFVTVLEPDDFFAVGQWYDDFTQTSDEEVTAILREFRNSALTL